MSCDIKYIGMDVHKEAIVIAVLNGSGKLVMETIVETKASSILQFIHGLRGELQVTWEEGTWAAWHLSIKLCLSDSCGGLETRLEHGIELVKYGSDILGQAFPFALLERRDGDAELEL